jgi:hypothetical protein
MQSEFSKLLVDWRVGDPIVENKTYLVTIKTVFDHDWQFHLLTSILNKYTFNEEYALFFTNHEITILNKMWENISMPPFVEAAEIVASWLSLQHELNL